ncbi:MAG: 5-methyltetrahydropteroyltriglutamate--homocysteine S-methyltransferase [Rhodospirillales bacterium]
MATTRKPPFRADHVGSLLRPQSVLGARDRHAKGELSAAGLRAVEDAAIRDVVKMQEDVGLRSITDGEYRRGIYHADFLARIDGITIAALEGSKQFTAGHAGTGFAITGKVRRTQGIETENFKVLKALTTQTPKLCIPSPPTAFFRAGRDGVDKEAYPDLEAYFADMATVYREELAALAALGCTYIQFDDVNFARLCDPALREGLKKRGMDPEAMLDLCIRMINDALVGRPAGMTVCVHICRGNYRSTWVAEGGYAPIAEKAFALTNVDGFFLEYDDARSGDFAPLRHVAKGKQVVLGLVTTKTGVLESKDALKRRIDEAATLVPLENLCLSPQCGFATAAEGNLLTVDDEVKKLRLIVETAREVWGEA